MSTTADCSAPRWDRVSVVLLVAVLVVAVVRLHLSAYAASNLAVVPDSVMYAVSAERLAHLGRFDIEIFGNSYAPGIAPGFAVLVLAPFYFFAGSELGRAIYVELAFALLALVAAFALARRLAGPTNGAWAGVIASLALLLHPSFERWSREVMTDIPGLALALTALWISSSESDSPRVRRSLLAGCVVAFAVSFRVVYLALLAALIWRTYERGEHRWRRVSALVVPTGVLLAATLAYNAATFGDPLRTGYHL